MEITKDTRGALTVERAARIHRVPLSEFLDTLHAEVGPQAEASREPSGEFPVRSPRQPPSPVAGAGRRGSSATAGRSRPRRAVPPS